MAAMAQHQIDPSALPYAREKLDRKPDVGAEGFLALDLRTGRVVDVERFPEARKPAWKLTVDFGPVVGTLRTSAQVTNYSAGELTTASSWGPSTSAASASPGSPASS
jgi:tRNA-binding protein